MTRSDYARSPGVWRGVGWALARRAAGGGISRAQLAGRALVGALLHAKALGRWMAVLNELHARDIVRDLPEEYLRAVRPHVHRPTGIAQRVVQLTDHHDWLESAVTPSSFAVLSEGESLVLCELPPPGGYEWMRLQLRRGPAQSPEGEMLLVLTLQRSADLQHAAAPIDACVLAFTRFRIEGTACLVIGGVRGQRQRGERVSAAELNQALHGWKPSVFLVRVAQELARWWHLNLVGLDPAAHRLHGWTYRMRGRYRSAGDKLFETYRSLWEHFGARNGPRGWVILPLHADDKLAATALSPEKRERQGRRADYWLRARNALRLRMREALVRPSHGASLTRVTQAMEPPGLPSSPGLDPLDSESDTDMIPSRLLETGPGTLL